MEQNSNIFIDWILQLLKHKKLIIINSILALLIAYGIARMLPVWYSGHASILPPYNRSATIPGMNGLGGMLGIGGSGGDFSLPLMATQSDLWAAIIKSPALLDTIVIREDLMQRYESEDLIKTRGELAEHISTGVSKEGILNISAEDQDPEYAAYLTNLIIENLDRIIRDIKTSVSGETRKFLEKRLEETSQTLRAYEDTLAQFQKKYGAVSIEDQAKVIIENAAQLKGELLITEVELGIAQKSYSKPHSKTQNLKTRKSELEKRLRVIEKGNGNASNILNMPLDKVPDLAIEYGRLMRETTAREVLYSFLLQQYEQAKIDEKRDTPQIQILARAVVPNEKSRPRRSIIAIIAAFFVFLMTCAYIIFQYYHQSLSETDPDTYRKIELIRRNIFSFKFHNKIKKQD